MTRDVEYSVHNSRDDNLYKNNAQVDMSLKLLIKSNAVVFLLIAKGQLVCTFKSSVGKLVAVYYSLVVVYSIHWKDVHT